MNGTQDKWEPQQLRGLRAELQASPSLCERALAVLGEATPESERILIRTDSKSVDPALARALVLAVNGILAVVELVDA